MKNYGDKVNLGLTTCKIFDQFHVKRCNNCQKYGHYYKNCNSPEIKVCSNCSESHATNDCSSQQRRCINCIKAGATQENSEHKASDPNCPTLLKERDALRKRNSNNLN